MKKYRFQLLQIVSCIFLLSFHYSQSPYWWFAVIPWVLLNVFGIFLSIPLFVLIDILTRNDVQPSCLNDEFELALFFIVQTILAVLARTFVQWRKEKKEQTPIKTDQPRNFELFGQWWFAVILWALLVGLTVLHGDYDLTLFFIVLTILAVFFVTTFVQSCVQLWREKRNRPPVKPDQPENSGRFSPVEHSLTPPEEGSRDHLLNKDKAKVHWLWTMAGIGTVIMDIYFTSMYSSVPYTAGMTKNHFAAFYASLSFVSIASGVISLRSARSCSGRFMGMINILLGVWWIQFACFFYTT